MKTKDISGLTLIEEIIDGTRRVPFHDLIGLVFTKAAKGYLEGECPLEYEKHGNSMTQNAHGGLTAAITDAATGFCAITVLDNTDRIPVTSNLNTTFRQVAEIKEGAPLKAVAIATDIKKSTQLMTTTITQNGDLIAYAVGIFVLPSQKP